MLEDKLLILRCKRKNRDAMRRIYEKYKDNLFTLSLSLLSEKALAEDVVHDVFVRFAQSVNNFQPYGSLKSYLSTCTCNRARDQIRARKRETKNINSLDPTMQVKDNPEQVLCKTDLLNHLVQALSELEYIQREVVILHLKAGMTFREIAKFQKVSINTVQGRYRYGLKKLKSMLNNEVAK